MTALTLRELGTAARAAEDEGVLALFAACREHVMRVAASPLLPDHVAVTTQSGFVELIDTATGEFRLFLTHLDQIPLDTALRCFALVPSLYAAATTLPGLPYPPSHHRHLLYSLAYSNELLLANAETGTVRVFAACESRPSTVACDGDYVVCGEGNGVVSVWRASAEAQRHTWAKTSTTAAATRTAEPFPLLWRAQLFHSAVVGLCLHRDRLACCSADDGAVLVSVEDGGQGAGVRLPLDMGEGAAVVALFPLTHLPPPPPPPSTLEAASARPHRSLVACLRTGIIVLSTYPGVGDAGASTRAEASVLEETTTEVWHRRGACEVGRDEVACASCLGTHLAAGTRSGLVLLYACDAARAEVRELVRFHVGYSVVGMQLFDDDTLLVVTAAGDVWRWPLADLLHSGAAGGTHAQGTARAAEDEDEEGPTAAEAPLPAPQPCPPPTAAPPPPLHDTLPPGAASAAAAAAQDDDAAVAHERADEPHTPSAERHMGGAHRASASVLLSTPSAASASSVDGPPCHLPEDEEAEEAEATAHSGAPASGCHAKQHTPPSADTDLSRVEPATVLCMPPPPPPARVSPSTCASWTAADAASKAGAAETAAGGSPPTLFDPDDTQVREAGAEAGEEEEQDDDDETVVVVDVDVVSSVGAASDTAGESVNSGVDDAHADPASAALASSSPPPPPPASQLDTTMAHHESSVAEDPCDGKSSSSDNPAKAGPDSKAAMDALEVEFAQAMQRLLGAAGAPGAAAVDGLRRGRRMSPRKVVGVLANRANQQGLPALDNEPLAGRNSTQLLEEKRAAVEANQFDFAEFRAAHRLEVDALPFRHPVRAPVYSLQDRVFGALDAAGQLCDVTGTARQDARAGAPALPAAVAADELRDVTYGKVTWTPDPAVTAERRRGGPSMARHECDELLFAPSSPAAAPPASTVFFTEEPLLPSAAWGEVLLLPLPLPPAPSVF